MANWAPAKFCSRPGCNKLISASIPCPVHGGKESGWASTRRGSAKDRGYGYDWTQMRNAHIAREPLCRACGSLDITKAAEQVDHITPIEKGGARLDRDNCQSLCWDCHDKKCRNQPIGCAGYDPHRHKPDYV